MAKVKLTKNELKNQRMALRRYQRFLPTLQLKKQQLQMEARKVRQQYEQVEQAEQRCRQRIESWLALFTEQHRAEIERYVQVESLRIGTHNIAGLDTPLFEHIQFREVRCNLFTTPAWYDDAIEDIKELLKLQIQLQIVQEQLELVEDELRITTQRVNLFEKVKIPEAKENIRVIRIYLGDQQTNAVGRAKIAKAKLQAAEQ